MPQSAVLSVSHTSLITALTAGFAVLLSATAAQADVVYQGQWDPAYGAAFPTMGWRVTANMVVNTTCATATAGYTGRLFTRDITSFGPPLVGVGNDFVGGFADCLADVGGNGGLRLQDVSLQFYAAPAGPSTDFYAFADYILPSSGECYGDLVGPTTSCLAYVDFAAGDVVGFQTRFSNQVFNPLLVPAAVGYVYGGGGNCGPTSLSFAFDTRLGIGTGSTADVRHFGDGRACQGSSQFQPERVTFNKVPEPATPLLAAFALLAAIGVGVGRVRRTNT